MSPVMFAIDDEYDPHPHVDPFDREPPAEGWHRPCTMADHRWAIEIDAGKIEVLCLDPCPDELRHVMRNQHIEIPYTFGCEVWFEVDDLGTDWKHPLPVSIEVVDDSTPSTPSGPAEYGYYITVSPDAH